MLDRSCSLHLARRMVTLVVAVVVVLILIAGMGMRALVPAASAPIRGVGGRSDCQRRYDAQRRGGAPFFLSSKFVFTVDS